MSTLASLMLPANIYVEKILSQNDSLSQLFFFLYISITTQVKGFIIFISKKNNNKIPAAVH